jgi:topoisomerase-4 subunit A
MESLPYEAPLQIPADEIVVVEEEVVDKSDVTETTQQTGTYTDTSLKEKSKEESKASDSDLDINNEGQITLF